MDPDIIVNGYRVARDIAGGGFFAFRGGGGEGSDMSPHPTLSPDGGGGAPPEPSGFDPPRVASEVTITGNKEAVRDATQLLTDQINRLTPIINAIPNNAVVTLPNGQTMSGLDFKQLWLRTDFTVTDRTFSPDRGGETVGFESIIRFDTVTRYAAYGPGGANGQAGLTFLIVHEMAHMLPTTIQYYAGQYNLYRARVGGPGITEEQLRATFGADDVEFRRNEQYANIAAMALMASMGVVQPSETYTTNPQRRTLENFPVFGLAIEP